MKQKLLLTSEGIQPELKDVFLSLLTKSPQKTRVLFVTTAAYGESEDVSWLENHRKMLRACGISEIKNVDLRFESNKTLSEILKGIDIIFVAGGNTYFLLKYVRESGLDKLIKKFISKGGLYIGNSAGSYIACPTIEQSAWKQRFPDINTHGLTNFKALNLVPFWIIAHYAEKWRKDIEKAAQTTKHPIIALNDQQAVLVEADKWKIVGKGEKLTFNF